MLFRVFDIKYDTDGKKVEDLPQELFFTTEDSTDPDDELSDLISDKTGWCHFGFDYEEVTSTFSFGLCPPELITKVCKSQWPQGYPMKIRGKEEWTTIAAAVNKGIDSHLGAVSQRSSFDSSTGACLVHPEELQVLLRRFEEDGSDEASSLRMNILGTLGIEEI